MTAYYNDNDPQACAWLRELVRRGLLPAGDVDDRSILDVSADDLRGYRSCHFFAGIGGWAYALRLAGWPDDRPVWTGSPPCQPFSDAGKRKGGADERHLWPVYFGLIRKCRPSVVFGEQVAAAIRNGWLDAVFADMESEGYACAASVLPAASVGAPHLRQRLWFVANAAGDGWREKRANGARGGAGDGSQEWRAGLEPGCDTSAVADARSHGVREHAGVVSSDESEYDERQAHGDHRPEAGRAPHGMADASGAGLPPREREAVQRARRAHEGRATEQCGGAPRGLDDAEHDRREQRGQSEHGEQQSARGLLADGSGARRPWDGAQWITCLDGKARPVEPGVSPLAHGIPARVVRLRGYGNAIVPQVAARFVMAAMDAIDEEAR